MFVRRVDKRPGGAYLLGLSVGRSVSGDTMESYAVFETGGKQYRVKVGDTLSVEWIEGEDGGKVSLDGVLAVSDGKEMKVGAPLVPGANVAAEIVKQGRGPKVVAFYKRRRKGSSKKIGHRQEQTVLKVTGISGG